MCGGPVPKNKASSCLISFSLESFRIGHKGVVLQDTAIMGGRLWSFGTRLPTVGLASFSSTTVDAEGSTHSHRVVVWLLEASIMFGGGIIDTQSLVDSIFALSTTISARLPSQFFKRCDRN